jgi:hypothetical protein
LWKDFRKLGSLLLDIKRRFGKGETGIAMTGELSDFFPSKREGVRMIAEVVSSVFPDALYFSLDGRFENFERLLRSPLHFSASNWLASARFLSGMEKNIIFIDAGSTTIDIIPVPAGLSPSSDFERLKKGELIFTGVLRTPLPAILKMVRVSGSWILPASEFFSVTGDVYLLLEKISPSEYIGETPDGKGKTRKDVLRRIARTICCDPDELSSAEILSIAEQVKDRQLATLIRNIRVVAGRYGLKKIIGCGLGEFLIAEAAEKIGMEYELISERYTKDISKVFPAYALANMVKDFS